MIYLDNAATTYPKPKEVYDALDYAQRNLSFNAGRGAYRQSKECMKVIDDLRSEIASISNANPNKVTILSSATEALNLIINGVGLEEGDNVYITPFEHNAIIRPLYNIKKNININIIVLPFNKNTWQPEVEKIKNMFALQNPTLVLSSQISNVTGLMIGYSQIFEAAKKYNSLTVLDAAQGYGIVDVKKLNVDFVVYAGHKSLYGPFGVGGFINFSDKELNIVKSGGNGSDTLNHDMPKNNHERYESGSPNVPAIYGTFKGVSWSKRNDIFLHEKELTKYLIEELRRMKNIHLYIPENENDVIGIVSISVNGYSAGDVGNILSEEYDICVRTGYHCAPLIHEFINSTINGGTVRISISRFTTKEDVDAIISALKTF